MIAIVTDVKAVKDDIKIITLKPKNLFPWQAGQYVDISFGGHEPRSYSIANAPSSTIEVHIKRGNGIASAHVMDSLEIGEEVEFSGPYGENIYHAKIIEPILAIAGGLGIAPIKAMIDEAVKQNRQETFTLYWGTQTADEKYIDGYFEDLEHKNAFFNYVRIEENSVSEAAANDFSSLNSHQIYISGSSDMIKATIPLLLDKGARAAKIGYDRHPEAANIKP